MRSQKAPSSVTASPCSPTPFVPSGHFPLIVGIVLPPWRGKAWRAATRGRPYKRSETRPLIRPLRGRLPPRGRFRGAPCFTPGALARQLRRRPKTASKTNFAHSGPQWGRMETQASTPDFARRKFRISQQVRVPRNGVRGKANMSAKRSS